MVRVIDLSLVSITQTANRQRGRQWERRALSLHKETARVNQTLTQDSHIPPAHQRDALRAIGELHTAHGAEANWAQRWVERITRRVGTPFFIGTLTVLVTSWIALNLILQVCGFKPIDEPPFFWLQGAVALTALYSAVLILTTQQRDDQLAALRDQLTLELAILSEEKSAKIIALLEELRRDDPNVANRPDDHAHDLSKPADTGAVLKALKDGHTGQTTKRG